VRASAGIADNDIRKIVRTAMITSTLVTTIKIDVLITSIVLAILTDAFNHGNLTLIGLDGCTRISDSLARVMPT
jgi:hypothetical protein